MEVGSKLNSKYMGRKWGEKQVRSCKEILTKDSKLTSEESLYLLNRRDLEFKLTTFVIW